MADIKEIIVEIAMDLDTTNKDEIAEIVYNRFKSEKEVIQGIITSFIWDMVEEVLVAQEVIKEYKKYGGEE